MDEKRICSECNKNIKDNHKFCPSCGGKVINKEELRFDVSRNEKRHSYSSIFIVFFITIILIILLFVFLTPIPYTEQVPYTGLDFYRINENSKGCDRDSACTCTHTSWLGLGACDSCSCLRTRSVTKYQTVTKYKNLFGY